MEYQISRNWKSGTPIFSNVSTSCKNPSFMRPVTASVHRSWPPLVNSSRSCCNPSSRFASIVWVRMGQVGGGKKRGEPYFFSWHLTYGGWKKSEAPVDRWFIPLFIGFQPSKVMQDFFHPQYSWSKELRVNSPLNQFWDWFSQLPVHMPSGFFEESQQCHCTKSKSK